MWPRASWSRRSSSRGLISLMSVVTLRDDFTGVGADSASLNVAGHTLVAVHYWTFLLGPQFCAGFGNGLLLGYLMYKSELVPRRMAMLGLIGGPLAFVGGVFVLFGLIQAGGPVQGIATAPEFVWELLLGIYPLVWGFKTAPILRGDGARAAP